VLPDADIDGAADAIVAAAMSSTGQKCTATRRIIAVGSVYEPLRAALRERVGTLVVGDGGEPSTEIGPVVSARAKADVEEALELAVKEGGEVLAAAEITATRGHFVAPTLLEGEATMTICREEVFGPVVTLLRATDLNEAITTANDTEYGLTASVFTADERAVRRCLADLDAGLIKVNSPSTGSELHAPFGGLKDSSFPAPREQNSQSAAEFFTVTKTAYLRLQAEATTHGR
jgi:alpha-ketoglutaric semialdehyde dehydrogenase